MLAFKERNNIQIDREEVLRYLGYRAGHKVPARISSLVDRQIKDSSRLIEPRYSHVIRDVERIERGKVFLGDVIFETRIIAQLMRRCRKAAIFAVTIGGLLEKQVQRLAKEGRVLEASIMDAVGSDAAEKVAATVENRIKEVADAEGLSISVRFSPGYCDWDVAQQTVLFQAMQGQSAGIRLTESCLMVPRKSISGVIGMSPHGDALERWSPCKNCKRHNCPGRR